MTSLMAATGGVATAGEMFSNYESEQDEADPPVEIEEMLQLQHLGVASNHVTWTRVSMTSDAYICLKQRADGKHSNNEQVLILDLVRDSFNTVPLPPQSEQCMMNPISTDATTPTPLLAVKVGLMLHVYCVSRLPAEEMCECEVPASTQFWTWLDQQTLGVVTDTTVFTWTPNIIAGGSNTLVEVFTRSSRLDNAEIISLKCGPDQKWFALVGLLPQAEEIAGLTELYSRVDKVSQCICAHAVTFARYTFSDNQHASTVLCAAVRDAPLSNAAKFHVVELGPTSEGNSAPCSYIETLPFPVEDARYDFPIAIQVWRSAGLALVVSKYGRVFICDMESAVCLCTVRVAEDVVFSSALHNDRGLLAISINGKVVSLEIRSEDLIQHCESKQINQTAVAKRLGRAFSLHDNKALENNDNSAPTITDSGDGEANNPSCSSSSNISSRDVASSSDVNMSIGFDAQRQSGVEEESSDVNSSL